MTPTLLDPHRVILATVDGNGINAKHRECQLKDTIWREMQTCQFVNTQDSAWSILDPILRVDPIKLQYIQNELDRICTMLPTQFAPRPNLSFFSRLLSRFKLSRRVSALNIFFKLSLPADSSSTVSGLIYYI